MFTTLRAAFNLCRPAQWVKNVFVLSALVFSERVREPQALLLALAAFVLFCLLSSAVYAFNDLLDWRQDAHHPTKRNRPIPSGRISPSLAGFLAVLLAGLGLGGAIYCSLNGVFAGGFLLTAASYLAINLFYTLWAKQQVLLDVILIALGFVLRALAGAQAIDVEVSAWMVICTFTLCLFLGFGKRRCEIAALGAGERAAHHRATLAHYTPELLTQLLSTTGGIAVITFLLYTLDPANPHPALIYTTPLVFYAVFRYALVIALGRRTDPTDVLIKDRPFLATAVAWTLLTLLLLFSGDRIERHLPKLRYPGTPPAERTFVP